MIDAPYTPEALSSLSTEALEALRWDVAAILYARRVEAILASPTVPAMEGRA